MDINIHHFFQNHHAERVESALERIIMKQDELAQKLRDLKAQHDKVRAEQAAAFKRLQDALDAAGNTTPEVDAAVVDLGATIQAEDDENPDEPPVPPVEPT